MIILSLIAILMGAVFMWVYRVFMFRSVENQSVVIERIAAFIANGGDVGGLRNGISKSNFVQCVVFVSANIDTQSDRMLPVIIRYYRIESYLLRRALKSCSRQQRAYLLSLLAHLPLSQSTVRYLLPFMNDHSEQVRFYALLALVAAKPELAIIAISKMRKPLSHAQVAQLLTVLCRGLCLIPYTPLLVSENYNMQLLGIALVRRFGIVESRNHIAEIVAKKNHPLYQEAVDALASFNSDIQWAGPTN